MEQSPPVSGDRNWSTRKGRRTVGAISRDGGGSGSLSFHLSVTFLSSKGRANNHFGLGHACPTKETSITLTHIVS